MMEACTMRLHMEKHCMEMVQALHAAVFYCIFPMVCLQRQLCPFMIN